MLGGVNRSRSVADAVGPRAWVCMATLLACVAFVGPARAAGRRYLLAFGENLGAADDVPLRYAEQDARNFADTLRSVGGVRAEDAKVETELTAAKVETLLAVARQRLRAEGAGRNDLLYVYVSAHAGEGELHLRGTRLPLGSLRTFVDEAPVGVAILVVDTCNAAWRNRQKGLEPVTTRTVAIERAEVEGRVFIASSGPTESALESDRFGGSYFTGHLVAGLRGAADTSRDGQVTLQEAFAYAYSRTIESSLGSGTHQTPHYEMEIQGQRDIVLSEPSKARGLLSLQVERAGDWSASPLDSDGPAERFAKGSGPVLFALEPGVWRVRTAMGDADLQDDVTILDGGVTTIDDALMSAWERSPSRSKGQARLFTLGVGGAVSSGLVSTHPAYVLPGIAVFGRYSDPAGLFGRTSSGATFGYRRGRAAGLHDFVQNEYEFGLSTGPERPLGPALVRAGVELLGEAGAQSGTPMGDRLGLVPRLGLTAGASVPIDGAYWLDLRLDGGLERTKTQQGAHLGHYFGAAVGLALVL